jgi:hypothetical protein
VAAYAYTDLLWEENTVHFPLTTNHYKHQHKSNFNETNSLFTEKSLDFIALSET